eukprot:2584509-Prymnesium_polylepis.1
MVDRAGHTFRLLVAATAMLLPLFPPGAVLLHPELELKVATVATHLEADHVGPRAVHIYTIFSVAAQARVHDLGHVRSVDAVKHAPFDPAHVSCGDCLRSFCERVQVYSGRTPVGEAT